MSSTGCPCGVGLGGALWDAAHEAAMDMRISLGEMDVRRLKGLLPILAGGVSWMAWASGLVAADAPNPETASIDYIRICDVYGDGSFYIPGSSTCLRGGVLALGEFRGFDLAASRIGQNFDGNGAPHPVASHPIGEGEPQTASQIDALGRINLDARLPTPVSDVQDFARIDHVYGSRGNLAGGSFSDFNSGFTPVTGLTAPCESTVVNRAFLEFAGLTAGLAPSMFDFDADAVNCTNLRSANTTVVHVADTASLPNSSSATVPAEDQPSRRAAIGRTIASETTAPNILNGDATSSLQAAPHGAQVPEIIGNIRLDPSWGAVQLPGAAPQIQGGLFGGTALGTSSSTLTYPALTTSPYGFALQGGAQLNADYLSPGDKLWLQATYEKGTFGYDNNAINQNRYAGSGLFPPDFGAGWKPQINAGCVFTGTGICEQKSGFDITGASKRFWIPSLSSGIYGSALPVDYSGNALAGLGAGAGIPNITDGRVGNDLMWMPFKSFDIGAESMYAHLNQTRPTGLTPDFTLSAAGIPALQVNTNQYEGRLRVQRAF